MKIYPHKVTEFWLGQTVYFSPSPGKILKGIIAKPNLVNFAYPGEWVKEKLFSQEIVIYCNFEEGWHHPGEWVLEKKLYTSRINTEIANILES